MPSTKKTEAKTEMPNMFGFDSFTKMFENPTLDLQSAVDFQRKNMEAMTEVNRVMFDAAKEVAVKQADFAKGIAADYSEKSVKSFQGETPEFDLNKQVEEMQATVKALSENVREVADMTVEAGQKAFAVIQERCTASVEEAQAVAQ